MVAHVLSLNTGTAAVLDALTTPNGVSGVLALDTSDSNRPRLFEGTLGGRKLAWLDEVPPISTTMLITASNATNPTALQNLTGSILSYSGSTLSLQSGKTLNLSAGASNNLGTPTTLVLTNATGLPISTGVSGLGASVATFLATPSSANLASAITDETGSGALVFGTSPTIASPAFSGTSTGTYTLGGTPTLSGGTLSGATTLPGSGQISSSGEIGLGGAAQSLLTLRGTYTTTNSAIFSAFPTFASSNTANQLVLNFSPTITPTGASLATIQSIFVQPTINSTSLNTAYRGATQSLTIGAGYSGVLSGITLYHASDITWSNSSFTASFLQFFGTTITNGNGITSGTATNIQFSGNGITAAAGAGGTVNNYTASFVVPSGASAGTTNNGLRITGNGGAGATNFAIYSTSTAPIQIGGTFQFLGATSSFPMLKRNSTTLEVRLADDSAYAPLQASKITVGDATALVTTSAALNNGAAAATGTLTNAPAAGNPTKWIPINDNGTTRYVPAW